MPNLCEIRLNLIVLFTMAALSLPLQAQTSADQSTPQTPCSSTQHRAFDFLVGHWEVHSVDGQHQGDNTIGLAESGCLLIEKWRGAQGGQGQSYNYFNPSLNQWHQLWVSQGAIIDYHGGINDAGAMHLEGTIYYQADGRTAPFTGTWSKLESGAVKQELKEWNEEKQLWLDWFTGIYTPVASATVPPT